MTQPRPPLPNTYVQAFDHMLARVAEVTLDPRLPLVPFWPLRGRAYDGELLIIGRSVNGWVDDWTVGQLRDQLQREEALRWLRADAEPADRDRMGWVTDLWGSTAGYSTSRSAFWRVARRISGGEDAPPDWPSRIAWTNLYKVSPAAGWNPGADLQRAQRQAAGELLAEELRVLAPRRVLAMTGLNWLRPFVDVLGLHLNAREGLVDAVGLDSGRSWVVAKHPMTKPQDRFVSEVRQAFAELASPLQ